MKYSIVNHYTCILVTINRGHAPVKIGRTPPPHSLLSIVSVFMMPHLLRTGSCETILYHFLHEDMCGALKESCREQYHVTYCLKECVAEMTMLYKNKWCSFMCWI